MDPDLQRLVFIALQGLVTILCAVLWFLFREAKTRAEATAREFAEYKVHIAENYVTHADLTKAIDAISRSIEAVFAKLERIEDKLDKKADKT
jgi:septal ring factor EnvC (AmiA/AmiB activator)